MWTTPETGTMTDGNQASHAISSSPSSSPFNPRNRLLERADLESIFRATGVHLPIQDVNWYRKALTHKSYCTRKNENFLEGNTQCPEGCLPLQEESNECLEFLGDAVLGAVVGAYLKARYPDENEGFLTRMRTKLVNGTMLSEMCKMAGLDKFIIISHQIEENNGRYSKNILEDCFEAFIGAVFEDGPREAQFNRARDWLEAFIEMHIDFTELITQHSSHKDVLCKYFQHAFNCMPRFVDLSAPSVGVDQHHARHEGGAAAAQRGGGEGGDPGAATKTPSTDTMTSTCLSTYVVCVKNKDNVVVGKGSGTTKKAAENAASTKALLYYGQLR